MDSKWLVAPLVLVLPVLYLVIGSSGGATVSSLSENPESFVSENISVEGKVRDVSRSGPLGGFMTSDLDDLELHAGGKSILVKGCKRLGVYADGASSYRSLTIRAEIEGRWKKGEGRYYLSCSDYTIKNREKIQDTLQSMMG
ncbi:MAG: hypothetical protein ABEK16_03980 [Candidatus Nanohalobium sp.]